jgi:hypothetical protein
MYVARPSQDVPMPRLTITLAVLALSTVALPQLAHADDKHFEPGHFALPTPTARAALSIDQRELTVERGRVRLKLWVHNPSRRDVQTSLSMPLLGTPALSPADLREAFGKHYGELSITHDDAEQTYRAETSKRAGRSALRVVWNDTFPAHRTVVVEVTYPFLYERHEVGQRESWSFAVRGAASNAWTGRIHYNRFEFCDKTIVGRIADYGGDVRAWNTSYPEYYRDYTFTVDPRRFRLDRYGKCMVWETEDVSANGDAGSFEVAMAKRWEKLTPLIPPGVDEADTFMVRSWCAGGSPNAAPMWNRQHLAETLDVSTSDADDGWLESALFAALSRAHGGATHDQLDRYWSELPPHIRHKARIRLLEYARAYLAKRVGKPLNSDFARACTGNVDSAVAPDATSVDNLKRVVSMLKKERAAFESAWRAIEEKY